MKSILLLTLLSLTASARQYIQCSELDFYSTNGIVINLDGDSSTIFKTNGVHHQGPDARHSLLGLELASENENYVVYKSEESDFVQIPTQFINTSSQSFRIEMSRGSYKRAFSCFSSIYND